MYILQHENWTNFIWDEKQLTELLINVRHIQGKIIGRMESIGFDLRKEAVLVTLTKDIIKSTEIEGEILNPEQVRSSLARRLGMDLEGLVNSDRNVDGVVDMMIDATKHYNNSLIKERLFDWHYALFPTGRNGMYRIIVGNWRNDSTGPMQVISGAMEKEKVHFQAPKAERIENEMKYFLDWFNNEEMSDPIIKAGIAHLWFVTLHPFDDGNGRIARALTDMLLARADGISLRFYSMSSQIYIERKRYYDILEKTQKGDIDITEWLEWFLQCLKKALNASQQTLEKVIFKQKFWNQNSKLVLNERQIVMLNKLLDDFDGKLTTSKWSKISKCSPDTALRDIQDLINKNILKKEIAGGRSTNYELIELENRNFI
jgi:Fic family protein